MREARLRKTALANNPEFRPRCVLPVLPAKDLPSSDETAAQLHCEICLKKDQGEKMLICDGCDCGMQLLRLM